MSGENEQASELQSPEVVTDPKLGINGTVPDEAAEKEVNYSGVPTFGAGANASAVNGGEEVVAENGAGEDHEVSSTSADKTEQQATEEASEAVDERPKSRITLIMCALCMAVFLAALDLTIIATALPTIAEEFNISNADYTWIGSAYSLACAAATPAWGKVSDIFGRKPILLVANVVFLIGSLLSGVSVNVHMLIAGRAIQGIGGGGLLTLVNICIGDLFSMRKRGMFYGIIGMVWAVAGAVGPVLGGAFSEYATWRWCFYINLPCDGIAFLILLFLLDIETPKTPLIAGLKAIDWLGLVAVVGGVIMFLIGLDFGGVSYPWSSAIVICLVVFGIITSVIFFIIEWKAAKYPMMPVRLFSDTSALCCFGTNFCHGMVFIAGSYFLPLYFQSVLGASPLLSGVYLLPFIVALSVSSASTGVYILKTGRFQDPIWFGMGFMALGYGLFINLPSYKDWARIVIFQILAGLGTGPNFQAPLIGLQSHIQPRDMATGTAAFTFVRQVAGAVSIVVGGVIFQNRMAAQTSTLLAAIPAPLAEALADGSAGASVGIIQTLPEPARSAVDVVYTNSLMTMWIYYAVIAVVGLGISLGIRKKVLSATHEVRKQGLDVQEQDRREELEERKNRSKAATATAKGGEGGATSNGADGSGADKEVVVESEKIVREDA